MKEKEISVKKGKRNIRNGFFTDKIMHERVFVQKGEGQDTYIDSIAKCKKNRTNYRIHPVLFGIVNSLYIVYNPLYKKLSKEALRA
ncbi:hypothetical protein CON72_13475 [Bacillus wiedmannii]|nr:hypothetical protein CON72_13475 [Bacillus wiedmannii]